jgi:pimeloyl-ACP methyl ester carboxylesterase
VSSVAEIDQLRTADDVGLTLAYMPSPGSDLAVLCTHGVGSSFYMTTLFGVAQLLREQGFTTAVLNNRGHDYVWMNRPDGRWLGAAYERFEDCILDLEAAVGWLRERGHERIVLAGHSLGCLKVAYAAAKRPDLAGAGLALCSGPRLPHEHDEGVLEKARDLVAGGRPDELLFVPIPDEPPVARVFSAATYVNKYAAEANTNILKLADQLRLPALVLAGTEEPPMLAFAKDLQAALPNAAPLATIEGANHFYAGRQDVVAGVIGGWLRML